MSTEGPLLTPRRWRVNRNKKAIVLVRATINKDENENLYFSISPSGYGDNRTLSNADLESKQTSHFGGTTGHEWLTLDWIGIRVEILVTTGLNWFDLFFMSVDNKERNCLVCFSVQFFFADHDRSTFTCMYSDCLFVYHYAPLSFFADLVFSFSHLLPSRWKMQKSLPRRRINPTTRRIHLAHQIKQRSINLWI